MKYLQTFENFTGEKTLSKGAEIELAKEQHDELIKDDELNELEEEIEKELKEKEETKKKVA